MQTLDEALILLHRYGPEYALGFANHGPMAAEALATLGRDDAVLPWVESYLPKLDRPATSGTPIDVGEWREALGRGKRIADWEAYFARELESAPVGEVLDVWVERLAPGLSGAATHGVIRAAHAARALHTEPTAERLRELAAGLGYWAGRYRELSGSPRADGGRGDDARAALASVPRPPAANRDGSIDARLNDMRDFAPFAPAVAAAGPGDDADAFLSRLTAAMAAIYVANAEAGSRHDIAFVHGVTGPSAVRLLAPWVRPATARLATAYAWQAAAAIHAGYSDLDVPSEAGSADAVDEDDLIDQAIATGDEHAIKFAEACLREHRLRPDSIFPRAARLAATRLG